MFNGFGDTTLGDLKAEKRLTVPLSTEFTGAWNTYIPVKPKVLLDKLVEGTPYKPELKVTLDAFGNGVFNLKLRTESGEMVAELERELALGRSTIVYESMLIHKPFAGQGLGRRLEANAVALFDKMNVSRIEINAGGTIGAYTWARFGFLPHASNWPYLADQLRHRLGRIADKVPADIRAVVNTLLDAPDPRAIWPLVDLRHTVDGEPLGVALLKQMPNGWDGKLVLSNAEQRARFDAYVKTAPVIGPKHKPAPNSPKRGP